ncbi:MAG TPA: AbrB/MazE/SpoVT family DNA-binding domain-containing protein [Thermoplasmata archaeon]|nr:AbrB/MazE/SpoVT family DNA-binding domain-containing protein [Thermoplasmata archaeon]
MVATSVPFVSRAVQTTKDSGSLRVTVPQVVAETLGLRPGDELAWIVDPNSGVVRVQARRARD